jgi:MerR family transcriptional regulator, light-induced transcriptional regulator
MAGWDIFYLGANTPPHSIVQMLIAENAELLALSATMPFHVRAVADLISEVRASAVGRR